MNVPKVLIIEDNEAQQRLWRMLIEDAMQGNVEVLQAFTKEEGDLLLDAHVADIAVLVVDACVPGREINTIELVEKARGLRGTGLPIVAVSGQPDFQTVLQKVGCDVRCDEKIDPVGCPEEQKLVPIVMRLLELSDAYL